MFYMMLFAAARHAAFSLCWRCLRHFAAMLRQRAKTLPLLLLRPSLLFAMLRCRFSPIFHCHATLPLLLLMSHVFLRAFTITL